MVATVGLLFASAVLQYVSDRGEQSNLIKAQFEKEIKQIEDNFDEFYLGSSASRFYENKYTLEDIEDLKSYDFSLFICKRDTLIFWNNNNVEITFEDDKTLKYEPGVSFDRLKNGYYMIIHKQKMTDVAGSLDVVALYLLKSDYGESTNKYLENKPNKNLNINENIVFSTKRDLDAWQVEGVSSSLYASVGDINDWSISRILLALLFGICIIIMLVVIYGYALELVNKKLPFQGFVFLIAGYLCVRILMYLLSMRTFLSSLEFFKAQKNGLLFDSLSGLLITSLFFLIFAAFFANYVPLRFKYPHDRSKRERFFAVILCVVLILIWFGCYLIDNVVQHSSVTFGIIDLIQWSSFVSICSIFIYLFGVLLILKRLVRVVASLQLSWEDRLKTALWVIIVFLLLHIFITPSIITVIVMAMVLLFTVSINIFYEHEGSRPRITYVIFWAFFSAAFVSLQVNISAEKKEINQRVIFAEELVSQENITAEKLLEEIHQKIMEDQIIKAYIKYNFLPESELLKYIKTEYFYQYFSKFNIEIFVFDKYGNRISGRPGPILDKFNIEINKNKLHTTDNLTYRIKDPKGLPYYITKLKIFDDNNIDEDNADIGNVILQIKESTDDENVYPELVVADEYRKPEYQYDYSYAIYKYDTIETTNGEFFYSEVRDYEFKHTSEAKDYTLRTKDGYSHLILDSKTQPNSKSIIVSKPAKGNLEKVTLFSFLFIIMTFVVLVILFIRAYFLYPKEKKAFKTMFFSSLKKRINSLLVIIVFGSLLTIGFITVFYFQSISKENQEDRLIEIAQTVLSSVENEYTDLGFASDEKDKLERILKDQSNIHNVDISVFDLNGKLITSSLPVLFDKGIIGKNMNAVAFNALTKDYKNQVMQDENIGGLTYKATYATIKNAAGKPIGYLNVPHFGRDKNLQTDISNFLVVLINVYIVIMLLAILLGVLLSNSVTKSLDLIGVKLRQIRLGGKNEKLVWPDNDEIGALVREYNTAIEELDQSVKLLAQAEREYAWQEMAKQVAHEIKNPLTPMKLSIQHLQRAQRENHPRLGELTTKVTKTLIEQIEHLTKIANEFSSFAQMPKTQEEYIELNEMLNNMMGLYEENNENLNIVKSFGEEDSFVYTDRTQLNRVFLNIVKNAIEAMNELDRGVLIVTVKQLVDTVIVSFSDNGSGIPIDRQSKVFVPSFTSKSSGMGLGLAISKNIIENAGGKIWFETELGKGTTFFIQLPLRK